MPKLTRDKGPLFVEEGSLLFFSVSLQCAMSPPYILHFIPQLQLLYHKNKYSYFSFNESIVPEWGLNTKIITCAITIKACYGITKRCADNMHFTYTAKSDLLILFIVKKFKRIDDIPEKPFH